MLTYDGNYGNYGSTGLDPAAAVVQRQSAGVSASSLQRWVNHFYVLLKQHRSFLFTGQMYRSNWLMLTQGGENYDTEKLPGGETNHRSGLYFPY